MKPYSLVLGKERGENYKNFMGRKWLFFSKSNRICNGLWCCSGLFCFFWLIMRPSSCFIAFCSWHKSNVLLLWSAWFMTSASECVDVGGWRRPENVQCEEMRKGKCNAVTRPLRSYYNQTVVVLQMLNVFVFTVWSMQLSRMRSICTYSFGFMFFQKWIYSCKIVGFGKQST